MKNNLKSCNLQYLKHIFSILDQFNDYVFWIRNHDMTKQIYTSGGHEKIWQRPADILYELPMLWLSYLPQDDAYQSMRRLHDRHMHDYEDAKKNLLLYQVCRPDQSIATLRDECFKCVSHHGDTYIIGITKLIKENHWHQQLKSNLIKIEDQEQQIYQLFFSLLQENFDIVQLNNLSKQPISLEALRQLLKQTHNIQLSKRELESIYYLCHGETAKQTARKMELSHRTIEAYLDNARNKTDSRNKLELAGKFAHYFSSSVNLQSK